MSEWPQGWSGDGSGRYGRGSGSAEPEGARAMPQVRRGAPGAGGPPPYDEPPLPPDLSPHGTVPRQQASQGYDDYDDGYNTGQVYGRGNGGPGGGDYGPGGPGGPGPRPVRPKNWKRRITIGLVTLIVLLLAVGIGTYIWADSKLRNEVDLSKVEDRPGGGKGTNYLIVGSDSREGLSEEARKSLRTGSAEGRRTDSMILLHVGENGNTMISLPRDSWVTIPAFTGSESGRRIPQSQNKLNASYSSEGPGLLVRTIEYNTGLKIDHYAEIGFDGFANLVDGVGGVDIDVPQDMKDKKSGNDLKKGKQTLNGQQ
ncbi:LCP family protein, partial [Streptomyces tendae]